MKAYEEPDYFLQGYSNVTQFQHHNIYKEIFT